MTITTLKEYGKYIGYAKGVGYIYQQAERFYVLGSHGIRPL